MSETVSIVLLLVALGATSACGQLPDGYRIVNPYECRPGTNFKLDCNECTCSSEPGTVGMCTLMACSLGPDECITGSFFEITGKLCSCPDTGVKWDSNCFSRQ